MLSQLFFVDDVMERYHCRSKDTARRYMRQMGATGSPLFVTEEMIRSWESKKRRPIPEPVMKIPRRR